MVAPSLAVHTCCGPCAVAAMPVLRALAPGWMAVFENPNIHPLLEYERRLLAFREWSLREGVQALETVEYGLEAFLAHIARSPEDRCRACVRMRLEATACIATARGIAALSTTLLVSPYQRHEDIRSIGNEVASEHGLEFVYEDMRGAFREGIEAARAMGLFVQSYCGCVFSEAERHRGRVARLRDGI